MKLGATTIQITNVHLQPSTVTNQKNLNELSQHLQEMEAIRAKEIAYVQEKISTKLPVIVCGDFNSTSSMSAPKFLTAKGFTDSFAAVTDKPDEQPTWHWPVGPLELRLRIDYIFHSPHFQTRESRILVSAASDHYLLVSKLKLAK